MQLPKFVRSKQMIYSRKEHRKEPQMPGQKNPQQPAQPQQPAENPAHQKQERHEWKNPHKK